MPDPVKPSNVVRDRKVAEDMYLVSNDERQELLDWIATLNVPPAIQKNLAKGVDLDKVADAWCPHCNRSVKIRHPNYNAQAAFIKLLFEYKLQKPSELRQIDINVRAIHAREELEALSDAELVELAGAEDAEWVPLPPAA